MFTTGTHCVVFVTDLERRRKMKKPEDAKRFCRTLEMEMSPPNRSHKTKKQFEAKQEQREFKQDDESYAIIIQVHKGF
jgi:hypothetical protein